MNIKKNTTTNNENQPTLADYGITISTSITDSYAPLLSFELDNENAGRGHVVLNPFSQKIYAVESTDGQGVHHIQHNHYILAALPAGTDNDDIIAGLQAAAPIIAKLLDFEPDREPTMNDNPRRRILLEEIHEIMDEHKGDYPWHLSYPSEAYDGGVMALIGLSDAELETKAKEIADRERDEYQGFVFESGLVSYFKELIDEYKESDEYEADNDEAPTGPRM